jgi:hypothetical protein
MFRHTHLFWFTTVLLAATAFFTTQALNADQLYTERDAVAIAAQHPAFAEFTAQEGWSAKAYDSHNSYGIWRVQFYNAASEDVGWADVSLERGRVYSWDAYFDSTPAQDNSAQSVIEAFIRSHPDVIELMPDIGDEEKRYIYIDYDGWADYWGVWVDAGEESLWLTVTFEGKQPDSLENPQLTGIYFPFMVSYDEWAEAIKAESISLAFQQPEIADTLRSYEGWQANAELVSDDTWSVVFNDGDQTLAQATVNILAQSVTEFTIIAP